MSAIGNVIQGAVESLTDTSSGTSLKDFLSKFSPSDGKWVSTVDPFGSFDLTMKLYPAPESSKDSNKKGLLDKLLDSGKGAVKNLANNVTGGLIGSIMNTTDLFGSKADIDMLHNNFEFAHKETFLEYLASANLLVGKEDWIGENAGEVGKVGEGVRPLELQLGLYCQEATIPNVEIPVSGQSVVN